MSRKRKRKRSRLVQRQLARSGNPLTDRTQVQLDRPQGEGLSPPRLAAARIASIGTSSGRDPRGHLTGPYGQDLVRDRSYLIEILNQTLEEIVEEQDIVKTDLATADKDQVDKLGKLKHLGKMMQIGAIPVGLIWGRAAGAVVSLLSHWVASRAESKLDVWRHERARIGGEPSARLRSLTECRLTLETTIAQIDQDIAELCPPKENSLPSGVGGLLGSGGEEDA